MSKKQVYIFDLDGTLADIEHRRHLVEGEKQEWDKFYSLCDSDSPKHDVISIFQTLAAKLLHFYASGLTDKWRIYIFSGRSEAVRSKTTEWLKKYLNYNLVAEFDEYKTVSDDWFCSNLLMRPDGDFTPDEELKYNWLYEIMARDKFSLDEIKGVFDDRDKVVKMWRDFGLTCFQVANGNF